MRRRDVSAEELARIIRLRQENASWLKIQRETGVPRRIAQRAHVQWGRSQAREELKAARKDVAAQAFRQHMESLIRLAGSLVTSLSVSSSIADMEKNAEQFFSELLQQDLLKRRSYTSTDDLELHQLLGYPTLGDMQFESLENKLIFEALKVHTREEIRWGEVLDNRWKEARDNCAKVLLKFSLDTSVVVNNFLNQERETNFLQRVKEDSKEPDRAFELMVKAAISAIWQGIREDKPAQNLVRMVSRSGGQGIVKVKDKTFLIFNDTSLADKVTHICNLAVNNLCKGDMVQQLYCEVRKMEKATDELRQMLNPVRLTPIILRTRCDLCPA
ncbi:hypothetical protein ES703_18932 [subsurface metagenome]